MGATKFRPPPAVLLLILVVLGVGAAVFHWLRPGPSYRSVKLADGTWALLAGDTTLRPVAGFPTPRQLDLDGEAWLRVSEGAAPLVLRSRLFVLTIRGGTQLHVVAPSSSPGEQVEVLSGHVSAAKSYSSNYLVPDELDAGDMSMINREIDLMEKEHLDSGELQRLQAMFAAHR